MGKNKLNYGFSVKTSDRLDLAYKIVRLFNLRSEFNFRKNCISDREMNALAYYLVFGFNPKTVSDYAETFKKSLGYIKTINTGLSNAGFLIEDKHNLKKRIFNPEMVKLSEFINKDLDQNTQRCVSFVFGELF